MSHQVQTMDLDQHIVVPIAELPLGGVARHPICDTAGQVLLEADSTISRQAKDSLLERNVRRLMVHREDAADLFPQVLRRYDEGKSADPPKPTFENTGPPVLERVVRPGPVPYDQVQRERLATQFKVAHDKLSQLIDELVGGDPQDAQQLANIAVGYVEELTQDSGNVLASSNELAAQSQVVDRSIRVAILAMSMAMEMGCDDDNTLTVALAALLHDVGMYQLEERFHNLNEPLSDSDQKRLRTHPLLTSALLRQVSGATELVRHVASQVHECLDGTGYPHGRRGRLIHILARIVAVADAYVTLTSQLRGRPAYAPYDVMVYLLHQVKRHRFDSEAVRGLLTAVSIFPVGTQVRLSDGREAWVLRTSGTDYMQPIVELTSPQADADDKPARCESCLDLAASDAYVEKIIRSTTAEEAEIPAERMQQILWE